MFLLFLKEAVVQLLRNLSLVVSSAQYCALDYEKLKVKKSNVKKLKVKKSNVKELSVGWHAVNWNVDDDTAHNIVHLEDFIWIAL